MFKKNFIFPLQCNEHLSQLKDVIIKSNTGADAIQKAPIVEYNTGIKCVRVGDFSNNRDVNKWGYCKITEKNYKQYKLCKDDILVTRTASLGLNKLIDKDCNAVYNNGIIRLKTNKNLIYPYFLFSLLNTENFFEYIRGIEGGSSTRPNMKIDFLLSYKFYLPSLKKQSDYNNLYANYRKVIINLKEQTEKIKELKNLYLKKFFN